MENLLFLLCPWLTEGMSILCLNSQTHFLAKSFPPILAVDINSDKISSLPFKRQKFHQQSLHSTILCAGQLEPGLQQLPKPFFCIESINSLIFFFTEVPLAGLIIVLKLQKIFTKIKCELFLENYFFLFSFHFSHFKHVLHMKCLNNSSTKVKHIITSFFSVE